MDDRSQSWAWIGLSELEREGRERDWLEMDNRPSLNSSTSSTAPQRAGNWRQRRLPDLEGCTLNPGARWRATLGHIGALEGGRNIATPPWRRIPDASEPALRSDLREFALPLRLCVHGPASPLSTQHRARGRERAHSRSISGLVNGRGRLGQPSSNERIHAAP